MYVNPLFHIPILKNPVVVSKCIKGAKFKRERVFRFFRSYFVKMPSARVKGAFYALVIPLTR